MNATISSINISGKQIGFVGMAELFSDVNNLNLADTTELQKELLKRAKQKNYIPQSAEAKYRQALWHEFRRWCGDAVANEHQGGLTIEVLGPGCPACDRLMSDIRELLAEMDVPAELEHIRDTHRIGQYGLLATPALIINHKIKLSGRAINKGKLRKLMQEEL